MQTSVVSVLSCLRDHPVVASPLSLEISIYQLCEKYLYCPYLTDNEMEAQKELVTAG